ncbi:hypothetical protein [Actinoplanes sp. NPDC048796]|uniref:hypothetical protein n=1 Tax=Actinoplanes sp. NPDC048796 TaxID=3155640 RepID=UPI0033D58FE9
MGVPALLRPPLAALACGTGLVIGLVAALGGPDTPGSGVQHWADAFGSTSPAITWLGQTSLLGLGTAAGLTVLTLLTEGTLLVLRLTRAADKS